MTAKKNELQTCSQTAPAAARTDEPRRVQAPSADVYERDGGFLVVADMPGVDEKSVDVNVERNVLTIEGRVTPEPVDGHRLVYSEYEPADYRRAFVLSDEVDVEKIEATVKHGVLRLTLPKAEKVRPRQIAVKAL